MLQIVKSLLESSSESSESDGEDLIAILDVIDTTASDEDEEPRIKRSKYDFRNEYFRDIIDSAIITAQDFKLHFRIGRSSFEELLRTISSHVVTAGRPPVPMKDCLLITMWILLHQEPYRIVSERFNISIGHCVRIFHDICQKLFKVSNRFIRWPKGEDALKVIEDFNNSPDNEGLQNVFGCLGVTHIPIPTSQTDLTYYDRKGNNSMILQAICNSKHEFMNINVGWPGSAHYTHVWINSSVYSKLKEDQSFIPRGSYLVADSTYPLDEFLIVPFIENNCVISKKEKMFNVSLHTVSCIINQAFGRLKNLFCRLQYLNIVKIDNVKHIVTAACILHNLSIRDGVECNEVEFPYHSVCELDKAYTIIEEGASARAMRIKVMEQTEQTNILGL